MRTTLRPKRVVIDERLHLGPQLGLGGRRPRGRRSLVPAVSQSVRLTELLAGRDDLLYSQIHKSK